MQVGCTGSVQDQGKALAQPWGYYMLIILAIKQYKIYKKQTKFCTVSIVLL